MLQMDSQFNTLLQSYHDNYLQYKITGDPKYQTSYTAAIEGLESIMSTLKEDVREQKKQIADFYKSGTEEELNTLQSTKKALQQGIMSEHDLKTTAEMRQAQLETPGFMLSTTQYIILGVLGASVAGLMLL
jgi:tryptophan synthase alpha subunit